MSRACAVRFGCVVALLVFACGQEITDKTFFYKLNYDAHTSL